MKKLSPMRKNILSYIESSTAETGYPPSVREICAAVGLSSPSTVHSHLRILKEAGLLNKDDGKTRSLSVPGRISSKNVPLLGRVTAGAPILAVEEALGFVPYSGGASGELFALNVSGDSMINAAILDGDMVIVRRQPAAQNGNIVVAMIEDEATVKRFLKKDGHIWLMPENEAYMPIPADECVILGLVVAVYRFHV